jgi:hypothetical protein
LDWYLVNKSSSSSKSTLPNKLLWFEIGTDGFVGLELLIGLWDLFFNDGRDVVGVCRPDVIEAEEELERARWFVDAERELLLVLLALVGLLTV